MRTEPLCFVSIDGDGFSEPPTPLPGLVTHRDKMAEQREGGSILPLRSILVLIFDPKDPESQWSESECP